MSSVGKLHVGHVQFDGRSVNVDMTFISASKTIGEDEIKSATIQVTKTLKAVLHGNGFWDYGEPVIQTVPLRANMAFFAISVPTRRGLPKTLKVVDAPATH